jgi:hypothetical protein
LAHVALGGVADQHDRIEIDDGRDRIGGLEVVTDLGVAGVEHTFDRRLDREMRDLDFHARDLGVRQRLVGRQLRQVELGREALLGQALRCVGFGLALQQQRLGLGQARGAIGAVEHRDQVALVHQRAFLDRNLDDAAGGLGAHLDDAVRLGPAAQHDGARLGRGLGGRDLDAHDLAGPGLRRLFRHVDRFGGGDVDAVGRLRVRELRSLGAYGRNRTRRFIRLE